MLQYLWSYFRSQQKPVLSHISINGVDESNVVELQSMVDSMDSVERSLSSPELKNSDPLNSQVNQTIANKLILDRLIDSEWKEIQEELSKSFKNPPKKFKVLIQSIEANNYLIFQYDENLRKKQRGSIEFSSTNFTIWVRWNHVSQDRWTNSYSLRDFTNKEDFLSWLKTLENATEFLPDNVLWTHLPPKFKYF